MEMFVDRIEALLDCTPDVYEFSAKQSNAERMAAIRALPPHAAAATLDILVNLIFDMCELDESQQSLEYLLGVRDQDSDDIGLDELRGYSEDWRLRVFERDGDLLYDFNGWPEDIESGAGVFYPAEDLDNPIEVFANCDEELVSADDGFEAAVDDYAVRRREVLMDALGLP